MTANENQPSLPKSSKDQRRAPQTPIRRRHSMLVKFGGKAVRPSAPQTTLAIHTTKIEKPTKSVPDSQIGNRAHRSISRDSTLSIKQKAERWEETEAVTSPTAPDEVEASAGTAIPRKPTDIVKRTSPLSPHTQVIPTVVPIFSVPDTRGLRKSKSAPALLTRIIRAVWPRSPK